MTYKNYFHLFFNIFPNLFKNSKEKKGLSKIGTSQRINHCIKITFAYFLISFLIQFIQNQKKKLDQRKQFYFHSSTTNRTENILISWIRIFHRSWIQISTLFGIIHCKTTGTRIFLFFFFFLLSQEIVHRRMFWLKLYARGLITIRPAIRTFHSPEHPSSLR